MPEAPDHGGECNLSRIRCQSPQALPGHLNGGGDPGQSEAASRRGEGDAPEGAISGIGGAGELRDCGEPALRRPHGRRRSGGADHRIGGFFEAAVPGVHGVSLFRGSGADQTGGAKAGVEEAVAEWGVGWAVGEV